VSRTELINLSRSLSSAVYLPERALPYHESLVLAAAHSCNSRRYLLNIPIKILRQKTVLHCRLLKTGVICHTCWPLAPTSASHAALSPQLLLEHRMPATEHTHAAVNQTQSTYTPFNNVGL
jgi:hypothetical protein